jgi:hypothetical protein
MTDFKLVLDTATPIYWPCWPFKLNTRTFMVKGDFKFRVYQREGVLFTKDPISVEGYVSQHDDLTVTVDFNGGTRLKRHTPGSVRT